MCLGNPMTHFGISHLPNATRNSQPKFVEEPGIETAFKQEVHNPRVREHNPAIYEQQSLTDTIVEDLTQQLNAAQQERDLLKTYNLKLSARCARLQEGWLHSTIIVTELRIENCNLKNRLGYRIGQWLKRQWSYDIYNPPTR